jgi:hypothetical protein
MRRQSKASDAGLTDIPILMIIPLILISGWLEVMRIDASQLLVMAARSYAEQIATVLVHEPLSDAIPNANGIAQEILNETNPITRTQNPPYTCSLIGTNFSPIQFATPDSLNGKGVVESVTVTLSCRSWWPLHGVNATVVVPATETYAFTSQ